MVVAGRFAVWLSVMCRRVRTRIDGHGAVYSGQGVYVPAKARRAVSECRACGGMGQSFMHVTNGAVMKDRISDGIVASTITTTH